MKRDNIKTVGLWKDKRNVQIRRFLKIAFKLRGRRGEYQKSRSKD